LKKRTRQLGVGERRNRGRKKGPGHIGLRNGSNAKARQNQGTRSETKENKETQSFEGSLPVPVPKKGAEWGKTRWTEKQFTAARHKTPPLEWGRKKRRRGD